MNQAEIKAQALALCEVLDNKKALDILAVNVADKTIIADWFVIASGHSTTQVKALCDELEEKAAERGLIARRKEGYQEGRWIVVDFGTILVHLFHPEERVLDSIRPFLPRQLAFEVFGPAGRRKSADA